MLAGNVAALLSPCIYIPILTYAFGVDNYDYMSMKLIRLGDDSKPVAPDPELVSTPPINSETGSAEGTTVAADTAESAKLLRASKIAKITTVIMTLILLVLWPMPLYGTGYVFSKRFFTGWVVVGIIWLFCSTACVGIYPLWEGRHTLAKVTKNIYMDLTGKRAVVMQAREGPTPESEENEGSMEKGGALKE